MDFTLEILPMNSISYIMHLILYHLIHILIKASDIIIFSIVLALFSWGIWFLSDSIFTMIIQFTNKVFWTVSQFLYPAFILILKAFSIISSFNTPTGKVQASTVSYQCNHCYHQCYHWYVVVDIFDLFLFLFVLVK